MNRESLEKTLTSGLVCFYSRSRQKLWTKGEESGNFLYLKEIKVDCDQDTLLIKVSPAGPTCHTGTDTCWKEENQDNDFLFFLQRFLQKRKNDSPEESYTAQLNFPGELIKWLRKWERKQWNWLLRQKIIMKNCF